MRNLTFGQVFRMVALITLFLVVVVAASGAAQATFNADEFESIWEGV